MIGSAGGTLPAMDPVCDLSPFDGVNPDALGELQGGTFAAIEGGRFASDDGVQWEIVDPVVGVVASQRYPAGWPTPDGRWLVGEDRAAARLWEDPASSVRTAWVADRHSSRLVAWSDSAAAVLATHADRLAPDGTRADPEEVWSAPVFGSVLVTYDGLSGVLWDLASGDTLSGACPEHKSVSRRPAFDRFVVTHPTDPGPVDWTLALDPAGRVVAVAPDGWWWSLDPATGSATLRDPATAPPAAAPPWYPGHLVAVTDLGLPITRHRERCFAWTGHAEVPWPCPEQPEAVVRPLPGALPGVELPEGAVPAVAVALGRDLWSLPDTEALLLLGPDGVRCVLPGGSVRWSDDGGVVAIEGRQGLGTWRATTCEAIVAPALAAPPQLVDVVAHDPPGWRPAPGAWCATGRDQERLAYRMDPGNGARPDAIGRLVWSDGTWVAGWRAGIGWTRRIRGDGAAWAADDGWWVRVGDRIEWRLPD